MKVGMIGLGRMGAGLSERLRRGGHDVVCFDLNPELSDVDSLNELIEDLPASRVVWMMLPSGEPTEDTVSQLGELLASGDILIDGGNSNYKDSIRRAEELSERGIQFLDVGTSGGIWGLEFGFCLMVGGSDDSFAAADPIFATIAAEDGYKHVGPVGSGHFTKMVHNGVEYGMMQSYAEGFELLRSYDVSLDLQQIASLWNRGSVVRSWLLELAESALMDNPELEHIGAYVEDSGEGRWTVDEAVERGVPLPVITQSLFTRFSSRDENSFALRMLAALRDEFGGHGVQGSNK